MLLIAKVSRLLRHRSIALILPKFKGWGWCILTCLLAGCATLPPPGPTAFRSGPRPTTVPVPPEPTAALPFLISWERQGCIDRNLPLLGRLWAEESRVVDGRGTADTNDDFIWSGRAAVFDRYRLAVFPNPPPPLILPRELAIQVNGDQATLRNGGDHWRFVYQDGRWWISELAYNQ